MQMSNRHPYPDFRKTKAILTHTDYHVFKATENRLVEQDPLIDPRTGYNNFFKNIQYHFIYNCL